MNDIKPSAQRPATDGSDDDAYPAGPTGIDEVRVLDAVLRLAEVASEVGWPTVLRVIADVVSRHPRG